MLHITCPETFTFRETCRLPGLHNRQSDEELNSAQVEYHVVESNT